MKAKIFLNGIVTFFKKEILLDISLILAVISLFITKPSEALLHSISWKTLALLFMLFSTIEGMKRQHSFDFAYRMAGKFRKVVPLSLFLIYLCFFLSMLVTNDVALVLIVPITITIFKAAEREKYIIPLLALETIAANLGSMLTPFGNPQNLFIYDKMGVSGLSFMLTMLPVWAFSAALILFGALIVFRKAFHDEIILKADFNLDWTGYSRPLKIFYLCLFVIVILTVFSLIPYQNIFLLFLLMLILFDRPTLKKVDYPLLLTFLCFFVFSSSIALNEKIAELLSRIVTGHEYASSLILSQVISNVPTAILLEPYSENLKALLYGVNIGGLGTIVASLASLITLRLYSKEKGSNKKCYFLIFTLLSVVFLFPLFLLGFTIK